MEDASPFFKKISLLFKFKKKHLKFRCTLTEDLNAAIFKVNTLLSLNLSINFKRNNIGPINKFGNGSSFFPQNKRHVCPFLCLFNPCINVDNE